ncbi:MAG: LuxR C-terminal-related transcriptional regulator [Porticoccaceae bacterium]
MKAIPCEKIRNILSQVRPKFGWEDYGYTFSQNKYWAEQSRDYVCEASPGKQQFFAEYVKHKLHGNNPISQLSLKSDLPQIYIYDRIPRTDAAKERKLYELITGFGWKSGMSIPVHGYGGALGLITLNHRKHEVAPEMIKGTIDYLAPWLFQFNAWSRELLENSATGELLTQREIECLQLVSKGKTSKEIAQLLCITKRTVDFHVNNATQKLGGHSRSQAASLLSRMLLTQNSLVRPVVSAFQ